MSELTKEHVYVIAAEKLSAVKIGRSVNPRMRMEVLQTAAPARLELLWTTPGGRELERSLHTRFREYLLYGEWFDLTPLGDPVDVVRQAIAAIRAGDTGRVPRQRVAREQPSAPQAAEPAGTWNPGRLDAVRQLLAAARTSPEPVSYAIARFATPAEAEALGISLPPGSAAVPVTVVYRASRDEAGRFVLDEDVYAPGSRVPLSD